MPEAKDRYRKYSDYLKKRFGHRVYRVTVNAGFSCPNSDGTLSNDGCIYCDNRSFSYNGSSDRKTIEEQIEYGIASGKKRYPSSKFIVYFQANTNTNAPLEVLRKKYDCVKRFDDVVGIGIGTRPDFVNKDVIDLIDTYTNDYEVWIEYGLQSVRDKTLEFINRNHTFESFKEALVLSKGGKIKTSAHMILGLPGEDAQYLKEAASIISSLSLDGIKIHPLHVIKGTKLEELFLKGKYAAIEKETFVEYAIVFLEHLRDDIVIQRIGADCPEDMLIEPKWILEKNKVLQELEASLETRDTFQGRLWHGRQK